VTIYNVLAKDLIYGLSTALIASICMTVFYAVDLPRGRKDKQYPKTALARHVAWMKASIAVLALIVLVVEGAIVPQLGRHYTPLLKVHLFLCACTLLCGTVAWLLNPIRRRDAPHSPYHNLFGIFAAGMGFAMTFTGVAVTWQLP